MAKSNPILVLGTRADFSLYTGEILKAEGFNEFDTKLLSESEDSFEELKKYDVILLGACELSVKQSNTIEKYVKNGGSLIALRPCKEILHLFGINGIWGTLSEAYIKINNNTDAGKGLTEETLQYHGTADLYVLKEAEAIAELYSNASQCTGHAAVVFNRYFNGRTVAFAYNVPRSIALTRQGNPELAGLECDGINGLRGMDLFTGGWLDASKNNLNQADEQMRLLTHCIEKICIHHRPLPRLWYFPDGLKCMAVLTNDGENSTEADFVPQFDEVEAHGGLMSLYVKEVGLISVEKVREWTERGHEVSAHPDDTFEAANPTWENLNRVLGSKKKEVEDAFGSPVLTNVNHWFVWCGKDSEGKQDFTGTAKIEEMHGIKIDLNYGHYDINSHQGHFLGKPGNYTGSGLAMHFVDMRGNLVDVYQLLTNVYDQQYNELNDPEGFYNCFKTIGDRSLDQEIYSVIGLKSHNDEWYFSREPVVRMLDYAKDRGIPVWTPLKFLEFLQAKSAASFDEIEYTNGCLRLRVQQPIQKKNLTMIVPYEYEGKSVASVICNGSKQTFEVREIKGIRYAVVVISSTPDIMFNIMYQ